MTALSTGSALLPQAGLPLEVETAQSFAQFYQACRLVFSQYYRSGYCDMNPLELRLFIQDLLFSSTALVAMLGSTVIGTATAKIFCKAGLPSGNLYATEINRLVESGRLLMESTKFACSPGAADRGVGKMSRAGTELLRALFWWCHKMAVTDWLVVVNPRVQEFYERELGFDLLGESRTCGHVANAPGVLLRLPVADLIDGGRSPTPTAQHLFLESKWYATKLRTPYRATPEEIAILLLDYPVLFDGASKVIQDLLIEEHPAMSDFAERFRSVGQSSCHYKLTYAFANLLGIGDQTPLPPCEPECFALRTTLSRLLIPLELLASRNGERISCTVDDSVPDGLVSDPRLFARLFAELGQQVLTTKGRVHHAIRITHTAVNTDELSLNFFAELDSTSIRSDLIEVAHSLGATLETEQMAHVKSMVALRVACPIFAFAGSIPLAFSQGEDVSSTPTFLGASRIRILVVDDNHVSQVITKRLVRRWGHVTRSASNGEEAVHLFRQEPFDLILMDIQMPIMDGFAATRAIRAIESKRGGRVPIIAVTSFTLPSDKERCFDSGMDGYLPKPINSLRLKELVTSIAQTMDERSTHQSTKIS